MGDQSAPRHGAESELAQALEFTMAAMPQCRDAVNVSPNPDINPDLYQSKWMQMA